MSSFPLKIDDETHRTRLIARILRTLIAGEDFETYADLVDALKCRLARVRVAWTPDDLTAAIDLVESNTPTVPQWRLAPARRREPAPVPPREDADRDATTARLKLIRTTLQKRGQLPVTRRPIIHHMPVVVLETRRDVDRRRALETVATEIQASLARCDALEREVDA